MFRGHDTVTQSNKAPSTFLCQKEHRLQHYGFQPKNIEMTDVVVDFDNKGLLDDDDDEILLDTEAILKTRPARLNDVSLEGDISGDITVPGAPEEDDGELSTLDEPVLQTVKRDLKAIGVKFVHVLYPKESRILLRDWDLWGPLVLCVFLAMMLAGSAVDENSGDVKKDGTPEFAEVFVIYWVGAVAVTLNIKLLGGSISFFQSICVLGYCVLPLVIALVLCRFILMAPHDNTGLQVTRCILVLAGFGWSTFASTAFLADCNPPKRKALAVYPIFLFYFVISWLVIHNKWTPGH